MPSTDLPRPGRTLSAWEPALAVLLGGALASVVALATASAASASDQVGGLNTQLVGLLFGVPAATTAAVVAAVLFARWRHPRRGLAVGVAAAVVIAAAIGAGSVAISSWWISALPSDSNRVVA
jgi:hypothetical protein